MTSKPESDTIRRPTVPARVGWAESSKEIADAGDDALVMGEFGNQDDEELSW